MCLAPAGQGRGGKGGGDGRAEETRGEKMGDKREELQQAVARLEGMAKLR